MAKDTDTGDTDVTAPSEVEIDLAIAGEWDYSKGKSLDLTVEELEATAAAYNDDAYRAPIWLGHRPPPPGSPAHGWVDRVRVSKNKLLGTVADVTPGVVDAIKDKRFDNTSSSFWLKGANNSPTPDVLALRHVAFLGAEPPAMKGLTPLSESFSFSDDDEAATIACFASGSLMQDPSYLLSQALSILAEMARHLREQRIEAVGVDDAYRPVSDFDLERLQSLSQAAKDLFYAQSTTDAQPLFQDTPIEPGEADMADANAEIDVQTLDAPDPLAEERAKLAAERAAFDREKRQSEAADFIDEQVEAGRLPPAGRDSAVNLMVALAEVPADFGDEGTDVVAEFKDLLSAMPVQIKKGVVGGADDGSANFTDGVIDEHAIRKYIADEAEKGRTVSAATAVHELGQRG